MAIEKWPAFYYHKKLAPKGQIFENQAMLDEAEKKNKGWVDTPAEFEKNEDGG